MTKRRVMATPPNTWFAFLRRFAADDLAERDGPPDLEAADVLAWADAYHARTGSWPTCHSGPIPESAGESWLTIEAALCLGLRGFRGRSTLARFLAEH